MKTLCGAILASTLSLCCSGVFGSAEEVVVLKQRLVRDNRGEPLSNPSSEV